MSQLKANELERGFAINLEEGVGCMYLCGKSISGGGNDMNKGNGERKQNAHEEINQVVTAESQLWLPTQSEH